MQLQPWIPVIAGALAVLGALIQALLNRPKRESRETRDKETTGVPHADAYTQVIMDLLKRNDRLTKQVRDCHEERNELRRRVGGA